MDELFKTPRLIHRLVLLLCLGIVASTVTSFSAVNTRLLQAEEAALRKDETLDRDRAAHFGEEHYQNRSGLDVLGFWFQVFPFRPKKSFAELNGTESPGPEFEQARKEIAWARDVAWNSVTAGILSFNASLSGLSIGGLLVLWFLLETLRIHMINLEQRIKQKSKPAELETLVRYFPWGLLLQSPLLVRLQILFLPVVSALSYLALTHLYAPAWQFWVVMILVGLTAFTATGCLQVSRELRTAHRNEIQRLAVYTPAIPRTPGSGNQHR